MFNFVPLVVAQLEADARVHHARQEAQHAAALASCYMAANWRPAGDVIDVEAREVLEPRLIGHEAAPECEVCGDTGLVGYPPDDYFACPGCSA